MANDFITWLNSELKNLGWNDAELAKRANMTPSAISMVLDGTRNPGPRFCIGVAKAFKMPQVDVFCKAGLITQCDREEDQTIARIIEYLRRLTPSERTEVLTYTMFRYSQSMAALEQKKS